MNFGQIIARFFVGYIIRNIGCRSAMIIGAFFQLLQAFSFNMISEDWRSIKKTYKIDSYMVLISIGMFLSGIGNVFTTVGLS